MTYLFNEDKSKIALTDAIKISESFKSLTIEDNSPGNVTFDLQSDSLYKDGYRPKGIVGWSIMDSEVRVSGIYMESITRCRVNLYNPKSYETEVSVSIDILWVKG